MKLHILDNEKLAARLHEVKRWHGKLEMADGESESDLEHSLDMLIIKDEVFERFEYLRAEFSNKELSVMIETHDTGEIFAGDAEQELTKKERAEHDRRERKLGMLLYKSNPAVQELYRRSFDVELGDKEALMCKFLDKIQAGKTVMNRIVGKQDNEIVISNIEQYTLQHAYKVYKTLEPLLSEEAHNELRKVLKEYQTEARDTVRGLAKKDPRRDDEKAWDNQNET